MKDNLVMGILITLLVLGSIIFISGIVFFGFAGLFYLVGIEYDSVSSLIIFALIYFVIGFFVDLIFEALTKIASMQIEETWKKVLIHLTISFAGNWIVLFIANYLVQGISLTLKAFLILSSILAVIDFMAEYDKKVK